MPAHLDFLSKGLGCHAICLLEQVGLLEVIKEGSIEEQQLQALKNPDLIRSALVTLVGAGAVNVSHQRYSLTKLGHQLANNIGTIVLPLVGYRNLFANQFGLVDNPKGWKNSEIDYAAIARASIDFGLREMDPVIFKIFKEIKPKSTVCDLGCGTAEKLVRICEMLNTSGLGIERDRKVVKASRKFVKNHPLVEVITGDITKLDGVWEDVDAALISMVCHDITPDQNCIEFLKSLKTHFPRLKCLVIVDMVSISEEMPIGLPGFDYVHGLQGTTPRSYKETMKVFSKAGFSCVQEEKIPNLPNTFVWVVTPDHID